VVRVAAQHLLEKRDGTRRLHQLFIAQAEHKVGFNIVRPVFEHMRELLNAPIADHDLINGYAANIVKYRDDVAAGRRQPLQF